MSGIKGLCKKRMIRGFLSSPRACLVGCRSGHPPALQERGAAARRYLRAVVRRRWACVAKAEGVNFLSEKTASTMVTGNQTAYKAFVGSLWVARHRRAGATRFAFDLFRIDGLSCLAIGWLAVYPWSGPPRCRRSRKKCDAACSCPGCGPQWSWEQMPAGNMKKVAPVRLDQNRAQPWRASPRFLRALVRALFSCYACSSCLSSV